MNISGRLASMVSNYDVLPKPDTLSCPRAAFILSDRICANQSPFGFLPGHDLLHVGKLVSSEGFVNGKLGGIEGGFAGFSVF
jgi:hypothetical protein